MQTLEHKKLTREYRRLRALGWRALGAYHAAETLAAFALSSDVRLSIVPDHGATFDDWEGDMFNPRANPDIPAARLARERQEAIDRWNQDGPTGIVGEYWNGDEWVNVDSCWGFIGDDWRDSGYDSDIMRATLKAHAEWLNSQLLQGAV